MPNQNEIEAGVVAAERAEREMREGKPLPTPLQLAARDALNIHDASNLSGVLQTWARHQRALMDACNGNSSPEYKQHPVNLLFLSKVTSLMGITGDSLGGISRGGEGDRDLYREADEACRDILNAEKKSTVDLSRVVSTVGANGHDPKDDNVTKYSGSLPIPGIGAVLRSRVTYNLNSPKQVDAGTKLVVVGHEIEHGWLYLLANPDGRVDVTCYVAGCDIEPRGVRKF